MPQRTDKAEQRALGRGPLPHKAYFYAAERTPSQRPFSTSAAIHREGVALPCSSAFAPDGAGTLDQRGRGRLDLGPRVAAHTPPLEPRHSCARDIIQRPAQVQLPLRSSTAAPPGAQGRRGSRDTRAIAGSATRRASLPAWRRSSARLAARHCICHLPFDDRATARSHEERVALKSEPSPATMADHVGADAHRAQRRRVAMRARGRRAQNGPPTSQTRGSQPCTLRSPPITSIGLATARGDLHAPAPRPAGASSHAAPSRAALAARLRKSCLRIQRIRPGFGGAGRGGWQ